jgi:ABC-type antimicrobial peptide transport system permease subunit
MNLSTARASVRIKEVGIKKAFGTSRKSLLFQFMGESILMAFLSLLVGIGLVVLFLPQFNEITGKNITMNFGINLIASILGITLFTGLISGSYPALFLSGFHPATILKGKLKNSRSELWIRKGL